ncbi:phosphopantetheine-binding protein [Solicola gregarius]|uniref:Phosphopantetheine-binding protein n=1 Tax=Solicola gregarius TaxID=2908642 RepID=A0AA46TE37_9ACTN|nr:phosphopantetheine-binding protein [Solicola gregarius]UYM03631.1 phosphopantetheine-binding protein [Solicola gregarius]
MRLTTSSLDLERFAAALDSTACRHEALRLRATRDSGRWFLEPVTQPVALAEASELVEADPEHPLRWSIDQPDSASGTVSVTLAVSASLVDRAAWGALLADVAAAYHGCDLALESDVSFGDHCYWLANQPAPDPTGVKQVVHDIGAPAAEPYATFVADEPFDVLARPAAERTGTGRAAALDALARDVTTALGSCGWQAPRIRTQRMVERVESVPAVGRTMQALVGTVSRMGEPCPAAPTNAVAEMLDGSFGEQLVQLEVDVLDLPDLQLEGDVTVEPLLDESIGWRAVLVRSQAAAQLYLTGPAATLPAIHSSLGTTGDVIEAATALPRVEEPLLAGLHAPRLVTGRRTLDTDVVEAAVARRADDLIAAGLRPGDGLVLETTPGPETVANVLAGLHRGADVLLIDPADPPAWSDALRARMPGAYTIGTDNTVRGPEGTDAGDIGADAEPADGDGAMLLGLSSAPGPIVLARVPLHDLMRAANALIARLGLGTGAACAVDTARGGEDLVVTALACGASGAGLVVVGDEPADATDLLAAHDGVHLDADLSLGEKMPLTSLSGARSWHRRPNGNGGRWWVAEAPSAQWTARNGELTDGSDGGAQVVDPDGATRPIGTVAQLTLPVDTGTRYVGDPRRTADLLRPAADGVRVLHTGVLVGRARNGLRVLRLAAGRTVVGTRTCLTDAWEAAVPGTRVALPPTDTDTPERAFVVLPYAARAGVPGSAPAAGVDLPVPLAEAAVVWHEHPGSLSDARCWQLLLDRDAHAQTSADWTSAEEQRLATEIVAPVLDTAVGPNDQLFSLGATSVQLMRILLQVKEQRGVDVPLARFFEEPTVATLHRLIEEGDGPDVTSTRAALNVLDSVVNDQARQGTGDR